MRIAIVKFGQFYYICIDGIRYKEPFISHEQAYNSNVFKHFFKLIN